MVAAELRYLGFWFAAMFGFGALIVLGYAMKYSLHLPFWAFLAVFFVLLGALAVLGFLYWVRSLRKHGVRPPEAAAARVGPVLIPVALLAFDAYEIVTYLASFAAAHARPGGNCFTAVCLSAVILTYGTLLDWRRRFFGPARPSKAAIRRAEEYRAALREKDPAERKLAMRPIVRRGYFNLGLLVLFPVLVLVLGPFVGIWFAIGIPFIAVLATSLVSERVFGR